jgi:hypothetical protein
MWIFIIPVVAVGLLALLAAAYFFARPGAARGGPHPDDVPGGRE